MNNKLFNLFRFLTMMFLLAIGMTAQASNHDCETRDQLQATILKGKYRYIDCFVEGLAAVNQEDGSSNGIYGFINKQGELVLPMKYSYTRGFNGDGWALVSQGNNQYFIDKTGKIMLDVSQYDDVWAFRKGLADVATRNQAIHGYAPHMAYARSCIDKTGKLLIPLIYTSLDCQELAEKNQTKAMKAIPEGYAMGVIDKDNRVIIPFEYNYLEEQKNKIYIAVKNCQGLMHFGMIGRCRFGLIDANNQILLPFEYDRIGHFHNGLAIIHKGAQWGIVNEKGQIVQELSDKPMPKSFSGSLKARLSESKEKRN